MINRWVWRPFSKNLLGQTTAGQEEVHCTRCDLILSDKRRLWDDVISSSPGGVGRQLELLVLQGKGTDSRWAIIF